MSKLLVGLVLVVIVLVGGYFVLNRSDSEQVQVQEQGNEQIEREAEEFYQVQSISDPESLREYLACGCGCCGDEDPVIQQCLYRANGDDLTNIIGDDKKIAESETCVLAGCSQGILYSYCD